VIGFSFRAVCFFAIMAMPTTESSDVAHKPAI
jgi:hypothetical protein